MGSITGSIRHYAPLAAVIGYIGMYYTGPKGIGQILPDLESISIDRITAHYQNLVIAAGAAVVIYLIKHVKMPPVMKDLITVMAWALIGYQIALALDPPVPIRHTGRVMYVPPNTYNPYALTAGGA